MGLAKTERLHWPGGVGVLPSSRHSQGSSSSPNSGCGPRRQGPQPAVGENGKLEPWGCYGALARAGLLGLGREWGGRTKELEKPCPDCYNCIGPGPSSSAIPLIPGLLCSLCPGPLRLRSTFLPSPCMLVCGRASLEPRPGSREAQ